MWTIGEMLIMQTEILTRQPTLVENKRIELKQRVNPHFSLLLSADGQQLIRDPRVLGLLRQYRSDFEEKRNKPGKVRRKVSEGKEGVIYRAGDEIPIAIKEYHLPFTEMHPKMPVEKQTAFLKDTLLRAEQLRLFSENYAPSYVKVPKHYGFLYLSLEGTDNARECFLFMERVNGQTMEEVNANSATPTKLKGQLVQDWGEIKNLFEWDFPRTDPHFVEHPLVTDLFMRNVLVDLSSPTQERPYTLWLIDQ